MESVYQEGDTVQITAALLSSYAGHYGRVAFIGSDRIEVAFDDGAVIAFLPAEIEWAERLRWCYAE